MEPGSDIADSTASSGQRRKRVRVRRRHYGFSAYNQFGIGGKEIAVGAIIVIAVGVVLAWAVYNFYIKDSGLGPDFGTVAVPEDSHGTTRF